MSQTTSPADLITVTNPRSPVSEAYRTLRTNIIFSSVDVPLKTLLVTSPAPQEGKSTAIANLAVTFAQGGRSTIIVDCDLRRPDQHKIWDVSQQPGLTSMILDNLERPPLVESGVENLRILTSGPLPPNPADLLGSAIMHKIIEGLKAEADIVLFDAPPVVAVTDAVLLASRLDGTLLILRSGKTSRDNAEQAKDMLQKVNARIIGAALLDAPVGRQIGSYYGE